MSGCTPFANFAYIVNFDCENTLFWFLSYFLPHSFWKFLSERVGADPLVFKLFRFSSGRGPTRFQVFLVFEWAWPHSFSSFLVFEWVQTHSFSSFSSFRVGHNSTRLNIFYNFEWNRPHSFKHFLISRRRAIPPETVLFRKRVGQNLICYLAWGLRTCALAPAFTPCLIV